MILVTEKYFTSRARSVWGSPQGHETARPRSPLRPPMSSAIPIPDAAGSASFSNSPPNRPSTMVSRSLSTANPNRSASSGTQSPWTSNPAPAPFNTNPKASNPGSTALKMSSNLRDIDFPGNTLAPGAKRQTLPDRHFHAPETPARPPCRRRLRSLNRHGRQLSSSRHRCHTGHRPHPLA